MYEYREQNESEHLVYLNEKYFPLCWLCCLSFWKEFTLSYSDSVGSHVYFKCQL